MPSRLCSTAMCCSLFRWRRFDQREPSRKEPTAPLRSRPANVLPHPSPGAVARAGRFSPPASSASANRTRVPQPAATGFHKHPSCRFCSGRSSRRGKWEISAAKTAKATKQAGQLNAHSWARNLPVRGRKFKLIPFNRSGSERVPRGRRRLHFIAVGARRRHYTACSHHHHKLPFQTPLLRDFQQLRRFAAQNIPRTSSSTRAPAPLRVPEKPVQFAQQFFDAIGRFIEHQRAGNRLERFQFVPPLAGFVRQKTDEMEFIRRQAARRKRRDQRAGPGTDSTRKPAAIAALTTRSPGSLMPGCRRP